MDDTGLKFERVYVEKSKPSGEQEINHILTICSMIPVLKYACDKNIPELLHERPKTVEEIASAIDGQTVYLQRLLRALSAIGFFSYNPQSKLWSNSKSSELFLSDYKIIIHEFENALVRPLRRLLPKALEQDTTIHVVAGVPPIDFSNPQFAENFHVFMHTCTRVYMRRMAGHLELAGYTSAIDIGGGTGALLEYIRAENPDMKLANFDLPFLKETSLRSLAAANLGDVEFIAGSFFESIPAGFDVYILKNVLHDWNYEKCCVILRNIRNVISEKGLLLILDFHLTNEDNVGKYAKLDDIKMMVALNADCKHEKEHLDMLKESGFRLQKIKFDSERISILYCVPE
jgi:2-polyprenyl-3-methyl-5-hydroxy-6-metoxy-1,4-benzoquinol methylase